MFTLVFVFDRLAARECRNARSPLTDGQAENKVREREAVRVTARLSEAYVPGTTESARLENGPSSFTSDSPLFPR